MQRHACFVGVVQVGHRRGIAPSFLAIAVHKIGVYTRTPAIRKPHPTNLPKPTIRRSKVAVVRLTLGTLRSSERRKTILRSRLTRERLITNKGPRSGDPCLAVVPLLFPADVFQAAKSRSDYNGAVLELVRLESAHFLDLVQREFNRHVVDSQHYRSPSPLLAFWTQDHVHVRQ